MTQEAVVEEKETAEGSASSEGSILSRMSRILPGLIQRMVLLRPMIPYKQAGKPWNIHITFA